MDNPTPPVSDLQAAILKLPCDSERCPTFFGVPPEQSWKAAYEWGHHNARHAAAELVAAGSGASIDTPEFRALSYSYAEAIINGSVPQSSAAWAALVTHIDSKITPSERVGAQVAGEAVGIVRDNRGSKYVEYFANARTFPVGTVFHTAPPASGEAAPAPATTAHTFGAFNTTFYVEHRRVPTGQEIFDAGMRAGRDLKWPAPATVPTEAMRNAVYMALHYYMSVQNPNEWEATDKAIAAMLPFFAAPSASPATVPEQHYDDYAVDCFAEMMKKKLAASRAKGRSGWEDPEQCSVEYLNKLLLERVEKGDPVDVANFCMMLRHYDARITAPSASPATPVVDRDAVIEDLCRGYELFFSRTDMVDVGYVIDGLRASKGKAAPAAPNAVEMVMGAATRAQQRLAEQSAIPKGNMTGEFPAAPAAQAAVPYDGGMSPELKAYMMKGIREELAKAVALFATPAAVPQDDQKGGA